MKIYTLILIIISSFFTITTEATPPMDQEKTIILHTNKGDVEIALDLEKAPLTCENFLSYVEGGFYKNTIFHRVIAGFMIQGGGFDESMDYRATNKPIQNEAFNGLTHERGSIAMARTSDPHSASSQFFINLKHNDFLEHSDKTPQGWGYAVFGKVSQGMEVVDEIAKAQTQSKKGHNDVPVDAIIIKDVTVMQ